jgi:NTP pyrophosphatase (non-canonical NTP hydrolase)
MNTLILTLSDYAARAHESDRFAGDPQALKKWCYGYFGEIGGLLTAVKKVTRDELHETEADLAGEEIGDALWYLVAIARATRVTPEDLGRECIRNIQARLRIAPPDEEANITFRNINLLAVSGVQAPPIDRHVWLKDLANDAGKIFQVGEFGAADSNNSAIERLGATFAILAINAVAFGLDLQGIANKNIMKIQSRWPVGKPSYTPFFDASSDYPEHERFPRQFEVKFDERNNGGIRCVVQSINSIYIGDRLTDNNAADDGYRFHDVFHLAYVAYLGWSPVVRSLLKLKRKSRPAIDENEDGARAMVIEEGIATWVFNHAKTRDYFSGVDIGRLDYSLLKQIRLIVSGYEVDKCPLWQWELAILEGFKVFRLLRAKGQGLVRIDMLNHALTYIPILESRS